MHPSHVYAGYFPIPGRDYDVAAEIILEQAASGIEFEVNLTMRVLGDDSPIRRALRTFKAPIAKGTSQGQRRRLPGKGGKGLSGGRDGDRYLTFTCCRLT
jgi:curved DNA-binding protein